MIKKRFKNEHSPGAVRRRGIAPVLLAGLLASAPAAVHGQTTSGELTADETWSGTVAITGDVVVPEGLTLTIQPGTVISAAAKSDDANAGASSSLAELILRGGALHAEGTEESPIRFQSDNTESPSRADWGGILIESGDLSARHWQIEHGKLTIRGGGYIMEDLTITNGGGLDITAASIYQFSNLRLENNTRGLRTSASGTTVRIFGGMIAYNSAEGIRMGNSSELHIYDCEIKENNNQGIYLGSGTISATRVVVADNSSDGILLFSRGSITLDASEVRGNGNDGVNADSITASNSVVENNGGYGLYGRILIESSIVRFNSRHGIYSTSNITAIDTVSDNNGGHGIYGPNVTVRGSKVRNNENGIHGSTTLSVVDTLVRGNGGYGIKLGSGGSNDRVGEGGITGNEILFNGIGFVANSSRVDSTIELSGNDISMNIVQLSNIGAAAVIANGNSWDTMLQMELEQGELNLTGIHDSRDNRNNGAVVIHNWFEDSAMVEDPGEPVIFVRPEPAGMDHVVSGPIATDATWDGRVFVAGDVILGEGVTLTIEPGTEVIFEPLYDNQTSGRQTSRCEFIMRGGTLIAEGTAEAPILFTSLAEEPLRTDWGEISIEHGDLSARHWQIEHGKLTIRGGGYIMEDLTITNGGGLDITAASIYQFSNLRLENNTRGLRTSESGTTVRIFGGMIANNSAEGIRMSGGSELHLYDCEIKENNNKGIYLASGTMSATRIVVADNSSDGILLFSRGSITLDASEVRGNGNDGVNADSITASNSVIENNGGYGLYGRILIESSIVRFNSRHGIYSTSNITAIDTVSDNNGGHGIYSPNVTVRGSKVRNNENGIHGSTTLSVVDTLVRGNGGYGIKLGSGGSNDRVGDDGITGNEITENGVGVAIDSSANWVELAGNDIFGNVVELNNQNRALVIADDNFWGTETLAELEAGAEELTRVLGDVVVDTYFISSILEAGGLPDPRVVDETLVIYQAVELEFKTIAGATYQLQVSSDLENWHDFGERLEGTGATLSHFVPAEGKEREFYRLLRLDP